MILVYKGLITLQLLISLVGAASWGHWELITILLLLLLQVYRHRFRNSAPLIWLEAVLLTVALFNGLPLGLWYALIVCDFAFQQCWSGIVGVAGSVYVLALHQPLPLLPLLLALSALLGVVFRRLQTQEREYQTSLDQERRLRYSLEEAKQQLLRSQAEIAHISEVQERNRIARDIHDHVGHSIAGILMQMQVAEQLLALNSERARVVVQTCVSKLAETLELLRDTVHNLRPVERLGLDYIKGVIEEYGYCPVQFQHSGDFAALPSRFLETVGVIIKEALTNTARHSNATQVSVQLDVNEKYLRLLIQDNGQGAERISEGLGLSSMRERVTNMGGTFTVNGQDGFMIVCVLYRSGQ